ncbi:hypothetical protein I3F60_20655 [Streptomyces sp. MUM 136J]|uniref:hypothetical protein n=1 Tax=Streptomyces sp. MUM 136J TaxID=2791992 RepID=UPI001F04697F|nr:hypothetical protein [Streptomyces sp. MUM 136J]MCH0571646.1 hypothetical protein [Streptomyces sp. MUM 136J]
MARGRQADDVVHLGRAAQELDVVLGQRAALRVADQIDLFAARRLHARSTNAAGSSTGVGMSPVPPT